MSMTREEAVQKMAEIGARMSGMIDNAFLSPNMGPEALKFYATALGVVLNDLARRAQMTLSEFESLLRWLQMGYMEDATLAAVHETPETKN